MPKTGNPRGRPKGTISAHTAAERANKEAMRLELRERVAKAFGPLVEAQIATAQGISHFMKRDPKTGKFERITELAQIEAALNAEGAEEGSSYWIWTKDPSTAAFTDLMNRAIDKPIEQQEHSGSIALDIKWQGDD